MKKKLITIAAAAATGIAGSVVALPAQAPAAEAPAGSADPSAGSIAWSPCPDDDPIIGDRLKGLECGSLRVPLDHGRPDGRKITLALTRAKHTSPAADYQGVVLLNRGQWPGQFGRDLPTRFAEGTTGLPTEVGATYDWIGFDPRGVGASEPAVTCDPTYLWPGHAKADYVPRTAADERAWVKRARDYAQSCGRKYRAELPHLNTRATARDLELMRKALGQEQISYLGYDYGTYLGSVYATMYPDRVRRMVLDTVVRPSGGWYEGSLEQAETYEASAQTFFAWIAEHDAVYGLGTTAAAVEKNYYRGRDRLREAPIEGNLGPSEYTDIFLIDLYRTSGWAGHAQALSDWVVRGDPAGLLANFGPPDFPGHNKQAMYNAIQCGDAPWPRDWKRWSADHHRTYRQGNTYLTWYNAWYNAPCAFWPVAASAPPAVGDSDVNVLLTHAENVAATPVGGAYDMHKRFPNSRLVLERDGFNHEVALMANGNECMNAYVSDYLRDGTRPPSGKGADASCASVPLPDPTP